MYISGGHQNSWSKGEEDCSHANTMKLSSHLRNFFNSCDKCVINYNYLEKYFLNSTLLVIG